MGNDQSHPSQPLSMNISPVPTAPLINNKRCRLNPTLESSPLSALGHYQRSVDLNDKPKLRNEKNKRTDFSSSQSSAKQASFNCVKGGHQEADNSLTNTEVSLNRTPKQCHHQTSPLPSQKLTNSSETSDTFSSSEDEDSGHSIGPIEPSINSQPVKERFIAWVNVELIMGPGNKQSPNQSLIWERGQYEVQPSCENNTGQFLVEPNSSLSSCDSDKKENETNITKICSDQSYLFGTGNFPDLSGEDYVSIHARDTGSFPVYSSSGNSSDSETSCSQNISEVSNFEAFGVDQTGGSFNGDKPIKFPLDYNSCDDINSQDYAYDINKDHSGNPDCSFGGGSFCQPVSPLSLHSFGFFSSQGCPSVSGHLPISYYVDQDTLMSLGFQVADGDNSQSYFGGTTTQVCLDQEGFTSLGFVKGGLQTTISSNAALQKLNILKLENQTALPELFTTFQSIPNSTLPTSHNEKHGKESDGTQLIIKHALEITPSTNTAICKNVHIPSEKSLRKARSKQYNSSDSIRANFTNITLPSAICERSDFPADEEKKHVRQASQGGSGKLLVSSQEECKCEDEPRAQHSTNKSDHCPVKLSQDHSRRDTPPPITFAKPDNDALSIFDGPNGYKQYYAAFLCCAHKDLEHFGISFHSMLENWGFRIFLPPRDLVLTGCNFENMSRALEERCAGKIIVILSINYEKSEECAFLTSFARVLDPDARKRNIIPVQIDKEVNITNVLKGLSIIRYNHDYKCGWLKQKLVEAIAA